MRRRTLLSGRLSAESSGAKDCIVIDMSERGARLLCRTVGMDGDVVLQLKSAQGFRRRARIAWRRVDDCGVEFIDPQSDARSGPHPAASAA